MNVLIASAKTIGGDFLGSSSGGAGDFSFGAFGGTISCGLLDDASINVGFFEPCEASFGGSGSEGSFLSSSSNTGAESTGGSSSLAAAGEIVLGKMLVSASLGGIFAPLSTSVGVEDPYFLSMRADIIG